MIKFRTSLEPMRAYLPSRPIDNLKAKLDANENAYGCSPVVRNAVMTTFENASLYPDGYCDDLREAVSKFYDISKESLIFGAGTDEVIAMLGKTFIEPGDEAITASITFSQYAIAVEAMDGKMVYAPLAEHTFNLDAILAAITDRTKLIFICNPNNPTGTYITQQQQDAFMAKVPANILVVFDEAYQEYVNAPDFPNTLQTTLKKYPNAMLLKTFSKIYGLASFRIGFGVADPAIITQMEKIRPPFNVTSQAQAAGIAALTDQDFVRASFEKNLRVKEALIDFMAKKGFESIPSQANFVMTNVKNDDIHLKLLAKGYIIRSGSAFGMGGYIRVSIGTEEEIQGFLNALTN